MAIRVTTAPRPAAPARPTYAALDLGTNNCRLLVARPTGDSFRVVDAFSRIIRLGEGVSASGRHQRRGDRARGRCARHLPRQDAQPRRHAGAADRDRGLPRGRERRRVPRPRRARRSGSSSRSSTARPRPRLAATGCTPLVDPRRRGRDPVRYRRRLLRARAARALGAGRSAGRRCRRSSAWVSLPVGVVTLAERHGGRRGRRREIFEAMVDEVAALVARFVAEHGGCRDRPHPHARHLRHGDDHRRRASRAAALRAPPRRRLLDERRRGHRAWSSGCWP